MRGLLCGTLSTVLCPLRLSALVLLGGPSKGVQNDFSAQATRRRLHLNDALALAYKVLIHNEVAQLLDRHRALGGGRRAAGTEDHSYGVTVAEVIRDTLQLDQQVMLADVALKITDAHAYPSL